MLGVQRYCVALVPHDDAWADEFHAAKAELVSILGDNIVEVRHVGSTAIRGIVAKPILDVAVVIRSVEDLNLGGMSAAGYEYCGERETGRYLFVRRVEEDITTHHVHCYLGRNEKYQTTVQFCRYVNEHPDYAKRYNDLKLALASKYPEDRFAYTDAKASFISEVIALAMSEQG